MELYKFENDKRDLDFKIEGVVSAETTEEAGKALLTHRVSALKSLGATIQSEEVKLGFGVNVGAFVYVKWTIPGDDREHIDSYKLWRVAGPVIPYFTM